MAFYDPASGKFITGQVIGGTQATSGSEIAVAVAEAVGRCQNKRYKASPRKELERLLKTYPVLRGDAWTVGDHPVSPLIELFVQEVLG